MPTLLDAPPRTGFVTSDTSIASPISTGHSSSDFGEIPTVRSRPSARGSASDRAVGLIADEQPGRNEYGSGVDVDTPRGLQRRLARLSGSALYCLRAAASVARYSVRFLPAVIRRHSFVAPVALPVFRMSLSLPARRIGEWKDFFQYQEESIPPFTYFTAENSHLLFQLLKKFGLNFQHLLLVQHDFVVGSGGGGLIPDAKYTLEVTVEELRVWPRQRVTFACRCVAHRPRDSAPVFETSDRFLVKNVPVRDCEALARRGHGCLGGNKEAPVLRLDPTAPSVRGHRLRVPMGAGIGFGVLSGDLNLVHAHVGLARWFGHRRPFAQGLYTSNRVMATLARFAGRLPTRFSLRFCRPLFLGQEAMLRHTEDAFEVLDAKGSLVATGTYGI
jgi:acyl dehydratase